MNLIKFIRRQYIVMTKGKYNLEYLEFYKKIYGFYPFSQSHKANLKHCLQSFFLKTAREYQTNNQITFSDTEFGLSFTELLKKKGTPTGFYIETIETIEMKVIRYKEKVHTSTMSATYFFLNEKFFLGEYRFSDATLINLKDLVKTLSKKYKVDIPVNSEEFIILDPTGIAIHYLYNGIAVSIGYFSNNDMELKKILENHMNRTDSIPEGESELESVLTPLF